MRRFEMRNSVVQYGGHLTQWAGQQASRGGCLYSEGEESVSITNTSFSHCRSVRSIDGGGSSGGAVFVKRAKVLHLRDVLLRNSSTDGKRADKVVRQGGGCLGVEECENVMLERVRIRLCNATSPINTPGEVGSDGDRPKNESTQESTFKKRPKKTPKPRMTPCTTQGYGSYGSFSF